MSAAPTPSPSAPRQRAALIANIVAQAAFGLLAMTICLPSMQEWGAVFGAGPAAVQLTFSVFVVAYGVLQVVYGPLSDRHGRRSVLLVGLLLAGAGSLLGALAGDIATLVAARALQGAGAAAGMVAARASVQDLFDGPERTRVMAYVGMAMGLCPPLATVIGGLLHERLGWQANFVLMAALALVLWVAAWRGLPARVPPAAPAHGLRRMANAYARLLGERGFVLHVAVLSFTVAAFYAYLAGAPFVLRSLGVGPARMGLYIMLIPLSYIVGNFATSRLVHRLGESALLTLGQAASLGGIVVMLGLGLAGVQTPLAFVGPLMLLGIGHGLLVPACLTRAVGSLPALAGAGAALAGVSQQLIGALGGLAVGWVSHEGAVNLGALMLAFTLCAAGLQTLLPRDAGALRRRADAA